VAARQVFGAFGTDTGGSIRQPAAFCGVVGVKPTYGRVSRYGVVAFASSLDQVGPLARTVADAAALLQAVAGRDPRDMTSSGRPVDDYRRSIEGGAAGLRIGVPREWMQGGVEAGVERRVREALELYRKLGATLVDVSLPHSKYAIAAYYIIAPAEASSNLARYDGVRFGLRAAGAGGLGEMYAETRARGFGAEPKRRIMLGTYALSAGYYDAFYGQAQRVRTLIIRDFARVYEQFDALLSPTSPTVAFALGAKAADPLAMYLSDVCTIPTNLAGHAAISVPYGVGEGGLPVGVQVLAPALGEPVMFRVARVLEAAAA
jgi:aspartyl-tRNA(Asn)/glutamyl-tRNA(Gln) amidotransferase subunit A